MQNSENPNFLKQKYGLHKSPEVEFAAKRKEDRTKEKVPQDPASRIQNYLDRFKEIFDREKPEDREQGIRALKKVLYDKFVIKPEEIPKAYWDNQKRIVRERGQEADIDQVDWQTLQEQGTEAIIADQKSSLDTWIDYLSSKDTQEAPYPDWLKYYAFRSILSIGEYDKEKKQFTKRSKGTVKPFPDLNREALAYVLDAIEKKCKKEQITPQYANEEEKKEFEKLLQGENFAKLYAWAIEKVTPASKEALLGTQGEWVKYEQNSDHMPIVKSLQGHGTGWCTAGESTAETQIKGGDFYVYYSNDEHGKPAIPRAAIRMEKDSIAEVRGIAHEQNLDPYIGDVVKKKLAEFPDNEKFEKKTNDMKLLTEIEKRTKTVQELTKEDLTFLYEINSKIEGFGYQRDPRIEELQNQRNPEEDMPIVFECSKEQIACNIDEITKDTKAYVGKLVPGIFRKLPDNIEHIYTEFPEGKIHKYNIEIGGKTKKELKRELKEKKINISEYAHDLLNSRDFTTVKSVENANLVKITVKNLGFPSGVTTDEIYQKAEELELKLCPAEVGPNLRLQYSGSKWMLIAMKQITDRDGCPYVFRLRQGADGLWLGGNDARSSDRWRGDDKFVFLFRPSHMKAGQASNFVT